jgi:predicted Ser/Thr protein kinase
MPDIPPLRAGDPRRLGGYDLRGRLGDGGQGVVYLGVSPSGEQVAVKWLRADLAGDPVHRERFLREVAAAQRVAAFCTAQIVGTGVEHDRPYIVSEYIAGPSLYDLVGAWGPRRGAALQRLAIGTATALTAIHQAGIVHRDFKPANVLMGPDGPRVIDFGIAKALESSATVTSRPVGTPSYMAPEQLTGERVGPAADMFAWAATMVFAARGDGPFGSDTVPAVINRILNGEPKTDGLEGALRETVAACLTKDPTRRPTAEQVLLRLLQHSAPTGTIMEEAAAAAAPPPQQGAAPGAGRPPSYDWAGGSTVPSRSPRRRLAVAGTTVAIALTATLVGMLLALHNKEAANLASTGSTAGAKPGATPTPATTTPPATPTPTPTPSPAVPTSGITETKLPGVAATAYENPSDAIWLTYYEVQRDGKGTWINYPRESRGGSFKKSLKYWQTSISPDGRLAAGRTKKYTSNHYHAVEIVDRETKRTRSIDTVKSPYTYDSPEWTKDGKRLLLTMKDPREKEWTAIGFIVVDVEAGKAKAVRIKDTSIKDGHFYWSGDESQVVVSFVRKGADGLRFYDLDGGKAREITGVGAAYNTSTGLFSPSGRSFVTKCPEDEGSGDCVWDTASGRKTRTVESECTKVLGWYDETHLFCWATSDTGGSQVDVVALDGSRLRIMLTLSGKDSIGPYYTRASADGH